MLENAVRNQENTYGTLSNSNFKGILKNADDDARE